MAFEISVDDDSLEEFVRQYIETRIHEQVALYIKHNLKGVIEARLAKLNLTSGNIDIEMAITETLSYVIDERLKTVLPLLMQQEMARRFSQ